MRIEPDGEGDGLLTNLLVNLLVDEELREDREGGYRIPLEAYGYRWYRVGTLSHVLRRERD